MRIARHDDAVLRQEDQRKSAFQLQQGIAQRAGQRALGRVRHQVQDDFGIAGGLEDGAAASQVAAQFGGVGDVAVVRHRHAALVAGHGEGLGVEQHGIAGGGIARVADGQFAGQSLQHRAGEDIGHVPHGLVAVRSHRRRWCRCRRFPARDAAARRAPGRPAWPLPDGRRWRPRRTLRGIYRVADIALPMAPLVGDFSAAISQAPSVMVRWRISIPFSIVTPTTGASTWYFLAMAATCLGLVGGNQDARRPFVERQHLRAQVRIEVDLRADLGRAEGALGQRHGQSAVAQVVRRFRQPLRHDLADGVLHALFVLHIERRRQAPKLLQRLPWRTGCRRSACRRSRRCRPAASRCGPHSGTGW